MSGRGSDLYQVDFMAALFSGFLLVWLTGANRSEEVIDDTEQSYVTITARIGDYPEGSSKWFPILSDEAAPLGCLGADWITLIDKRHITLDSCIGDPRPRPPDYDWRNYWGNKAGEQEQGVFDSPEQAALYGVFGGSGVPGQRLLSADVVGMRLEWGHGSPVRLEYLGRAVDVTPIQNSAQRWQPPKLTLVADRTFASIGVLTGRQQRPTAIFVRPAPILDTVIDQDSSSPGVDSYRFPISASDIDDGIEQRSLTVTIRVFRHGVQKSCSTGQRAEVPEAEWKSEVLLTLTDCVL
jgi:hypothetical protein